jgi:hypothetical protein
LTLSAYSSDPVRDLNYLQDHQNGSLTPQFSWVIR